VPRAGARMIALMVRKYARKFRVDRGRRKERGREGGRERKRERERERERTAFPISLTWPAAHYAFFAGRRAISRQRAGRCPPVCSTRFPEPSPKDRTVA